jgi:ribose transport system permease protein
MLSIRQLQRTVQEQQRYGSVILVLAAMVVVFALAAPGFFTLSNVNTIIRQGAMLAIVTFGATMVIATAGIDLSIGSVMAFAGVVTGIGFVSGWGLVPAVLAGLLVATLCGALTGWLVGYRELPPFVATLGMMGIARGIALVASDGRAVTGMDAAFTDLLSGDLLGLPAPVFLVLGALALSHALFAHTSWGTGLLAIGGNRLGARLAGVPVRRYEMLAYLYTGLLAGVAGLLTIPRMGAAHPLAGQGYEFDAIAAAVIGGAALEGGRGSALGALLGAAMITILRNGLGVLGVGLQAQLLIIGSVVALAFALDHFSARQAAVGRVA